MEGEMAKQTIEIDDDVWAVLKRNAEPFVDTPNSVLRRLLLDAPAAAPKAEGPKPQAPAKTPAPPKPAPASPKVHDINALLSSDEGEERKAGKSASGNAAAESAPAAGTVSYNTADADVLGTKNENKFIMASKKPAKLHLRNGKVIEIDSYEITENVLYGKVLGCTLDFEVSEIREITCDKK